MEKNKESVPGLPSGWVREEVVRKSGLSAGKTDVYYYSPDGRKCRSKPQMVRAVGDRVDMTAFDFRSGKLLYNAMRKNKTRVKGSYEYTRGVRNDASLVLPIRQTASIFKQPVTVKRTQRSSETKIELKHGHQEQPKQLFWEKRLQGYTACYITEEIIKILDLPKSMQGVGPNMTDDSLLRSISACLHLNNEPVTGQLASTASILKNPGASINVNQPLIQKVVITDEDIRRQEHRVKLARRRLEEALK